MRVTASADYGVRVLVELAGRQRPASRDALAEATGTPAQYLSAVLGRLRRAGLVGAQRGAEGGYWIARPCEEISVADVLIGLDGAPAGPPVHTPRRQGSPLESLWLDLQDEYLTAATGVTIASLAGLDKS